MSRTRKAGFDSFTIDVDIYQDYKVRKLIRYQGGRAISVYILLLCFIYKRGYYIEWDKELLTIISEQTGYSEAYIMEVIKCCLQVGLFSEGLFNAEKVLSSKSIQRRYMQSCSAAHRKYCIIEHSLISQEIKGEEQAKAEKRTDTETKKKDKGTRRQEAQATEGASVSIEEAEKQLTNDEKFISASAERYGVTEDEIKKSLPLFLLECKAKDTRHESYKELKTHCFNWLRLHLQESTVRAGTAHMKPTPQLCGYVSDIEKRRREHDAEVERMYEEAERKRMKPDEVKKMLASGELSNISRLLNN